MSDVLQLFSLSFVVFTLLLFLRAALHKAFDLLEFQGFVADYDLLPEALVKPASYLLITLELLTVALLLFSASCSLGLLLAAALLCLYGAAILLNLRRGHTRIECGCGGTPQLLNRNLLLRNAVLVVLALLPVAVTPHASGSIDVAVAVLAGVCLWVLYALLEQINATHAALTSKRV